jgi:hypothetical protein
MYLLPHVLPKEPTYDTIKSLWSFTEIKFMLKSSAMLISSLVKGKSTSSPATSELK